MRKLRKIWLLAAALIITHYSANGQTFDEWFKQKETQKKYLIQQIAALKVYTEYAEKGYNILENGLNAIDKFKKGKFQLDKGFFNLLATVNPNFQSRAKVAVVACLQLGIIKRCGTILKMAGSNNNINSFEKEYLNQVLFKLIDNCAEVLNDLIQLAKPGELKLNDNDRLARINKIIREMQDNGEFVKSFSNDLQKLIANRNRDVIDTARFRQLYLK